MSRDTTRAASGAIAAACFYLAYCALVLATPVKQYEPDDWSYRAQIQAHLTGQLALDADEFAQLELAMRAAGGSANQWVVVPGGRYLSEKNPGYALLATPFFALSLGRYAQLVFLALACAAMFLAARRLGGELCGAAAVGCMLASPALLVMGSRPYMPTLSEVSLVAIAFGCYVCAVTGGRRWLGTVAFAVAGLAIWVRFTSALTLVLLGAHAVLCRRQLGLSWGTLGRWALAAWLPLLLLLIYNVYLFGRPFAHAYGHGIRLIEFNLTAVRRNMPSLGARELWAIPTLVLVIALLGRWAFARRLDLPLHLALLFVAGVLAYYAAWLSYGWTAMAQRLPYMVSVRPLLPAAAPAALLAAALIAKLPARANVLAAAAVIGLFGGFSVAEFREVSRLGTHFIPGNQRPPIHDGVCPPSLVCPGISAMPRNSSFRSQDSGMGRTRTRS